jgi:hypothetical protein
MSCRFQSFSLLPSFVTTRVPAFSHDGVVSGLPHQCAREFLGPRATAGVELRGVRFGGRLPRGLEPAGQGARFGVGALPLRCRQRLALLRHLAKAFRAGKQGPT